ncbi:MAG: UxaA family hydrolase [Clostridium sp.]|jgi:altronate dehydratase small subunit|uniref:UxaA family hydrolase n=1 Tax=Clostridium sp. TaxID=1506 RepID=UPI0025C153E7|nr:UxaA family hydrolase [Clostridium sp.]MCH3965982.1 UxaA family hydrolase [Clostridium sp.]MCI1715930.1 UxaA family hydrolase [Clostridium sp.]MCI1800398.1 UxaA family hydrolase [Clostridium sp.]MCI1814107.1 UxaA family hydrolase [Clostridium sp.]MCI1871005.1 UxaA family hydrolase [Clostridium sp.]
MAKVKAIVIKAIDNVATATSEILPGTDIVLKINNDDLKLHVLEKIPFGHKLAIRNIDEDEKIIKYGEAIGVASENIKQGEHVHVHNLKPIRGRGDLNQK